MGKKFANKHTVWIEWTPNFLSTYPPFVFPLLIIAFLYLFGFCVSYYNNFHVLYITSRSIYICLFGIFYAFTFGKIHVNNFRKLILRLRILVDISDHEFDEFIDKWFSILCDYKKYLISSLVVIITCTVFGNYFWQDALINKYFKFMWFMEIGWYQSPIFPRLLILDIFGIFVFSLMASGVRFFLIYIIFIKEFSKYQISVSPKIANLFIKKIDDLNLVTFFHWSIGISLVIISFFQFKNINFISIMITTFLTISGSIPIIISKNYFRKMISNKKESLIDQLLIFSTKNIKSNFPSIKELEDFSILNKVSEEIYHSNVRTYDFPNILKFIGSLLMPIISFILSIAEII